MTDSNLKKLAEELCDRSMKYEDYNGFDCEEFIDEIVIPTIQRVANQSWEEGYKKGQEDAKNRS